MVEGASQTYHLIDPGGKWSHNRSHTVACRHQESKPDGTVRAVVASIDLTTNRTKVVTDAGQTLVLAMAHQTLADLQVGDAFTLTVSPQGELTAVVSSRGESGAQR